MRKEQREYLVKKMREAFNEKLKAHQKTKPEEPNLENHLIVAFSDGSIKFADLDALKAKIRNRILGMQEKLGGNVLIEKSSRAWSDNDKLYLKILPEDLIQLPESYLKAMAEYNKAKEAYENELQILYAKMNTLETKLMLASDKNLESLIVEADNLADISLMNEQLLLTS